MSEMRNELVMILDVHGLKNKFPPPSTQGHMSGVLSDLRKAKEHCFVMLV